MLWSHRTLLKHLKSVDTTNDKHKTFQPMHNPTQLWSLHALSVPSLSSFCRMGMEWNCWMPKSEHGHAVFLSCAGYSWCIKKLNMKKLKFSWVADAGFKCDVIFHEWLMIHFPGIPSLWRFHASRGKGSGRELLIGSWVALWRFHVSQGSLSCVHCPQESTIWMYFLCTVRIWFCWRWSSTRLSARSMVLSIHSSFTVWEYCSWCETVHLAANHIPHQQVCRNDSRTVIDITWILTLLLYLTFT